MLMSSSIYSISFSGDESPSGKSTNHLIRITRVWVHCIYHECIFSKVLWYLSRKCVKLQNIIDANLLMTFQKLIWNKKEETMTKMFCRAKVKDRTGCVDKIITLLWYCTVWYESFIIYSYVMYSLQWLFIKLRTFVMLFDFSH